MAVKVNPGRVSQQDMMNAQAYSGIMSKIEKIGKGAYIYQVSIRDSKGNSASKYEKLVLLQ